ncbi:GNAT family N-acetyltransferase [Megasphaera paucivorans]|uniref:GNAT family N-acetyltransferase n=1 Tax=Megasphaera paucivorans TaxID=349095 RepID=UPI003D0241AD
MTKQRKLTDDLYESTMFHDDKADYQMVFGLDVLPSEQHQGIAKMLMKAYIAAAHERNKKAVILTCKKHLIPFYKQFGYTCEGRSGSLHGGAVWYDMILLLHEKT